MRWLVLLALLTQAPVALTRAAPSDEPGDVILFAGDPARLGAEERALLEHAVVLCLQDAEPAWTRARAPVLLEPRGETLPRDAALAQRVEHAPAVVLTGGTFLDWWHTLRPDGEPSRLQRALLAARRRGAALAASGGAAAWLAAGFAPRDELERPERNPRAPRVTDVALVGLGLGGGVLLDGGDIHGAGLPRWIDAAWRHRSARALFLEGDVAWRWNERARRATVSGARGGRVWLLERGDERAGRDVLRGRLSWLADGDAYDLRRRRSIARPGAPLGAVGRAVVQRACDRDAPALATRLLDVLVTLLRDDPAPARVELLPPAGPAEPWLVLVLDSATSIVRPLEGPPRLLDARVAVLGLPAAEDGGVHR